MTRLAVLLAALVLAVSAAPVHSSAHIHRSGEKGANGETLRITLAPGSFRTASTRATFAPSQMVWAEVRINGKVAPFAAGRSVSASREGVSVVLLSSRKRAPLVVRMANAGTRKAVVVVRVEW